MQIIKSRNNLSVKFNISQLKPLTQKILNISVSDNFCKQIFNKIAEQVELKQAISSQMIYEIIKSYEKEIIK